MGPCIVIATALMMTSLQPLWADTFVLNDGTTIEGSIIRATKSSIAIKRTIGGLQLVRLSRIEEIRIDKPGDPPIVGRLIGWTGGIHVVDVGDKIVEMRDGEILSEVPSPSTGIVIAEPAAAPVAVDQSQSSSQRTVAENPSQPGNARSSGTLAMHPESPIEPAPAVTPAVRLETAVGEPPSTNGNIMIDVSATPAREGETVVFDLRLSQPLERPLVIAYATIGGTAKDGVDFETQSGIVTFEPGDTSAEVRTPLFDDDAAEGQEQFWLYLSVDPSLAKLNERQVTAIIMDDD